MSFILSGAVSAAVIVACVLLRVPVALTILCVSIIIAGGIAGFGNNE